MKPALFQYIILKCTLNLVLLGFFPLHTHASSVTQFVFVSAPLSLATNDASCIFTIQSQNNSGEKTNVVSTHDIIYATSSSTGTFSTNNTNWNPITTRTMASNSANVNFYYKDSTTGIVTISVTATERANPTNTFSLQKSITIGATSECSQNTTQNNSGTTTQNASSGSSGGGGSSVTFFTQDEKITEEKEIKPKPPSIYSISLKREPTITAHTETRFLPTVLEDSVYTLKVGKFVWTMGDGTQYEKRKDEVIYHTYKNPGDYLLILDFYRTVFDEYPTATLRTKITVHEPSLIIQDITSDGTLVLKNTSNFDIDTTGWNIVANGQTYGLPNRTVALAGSALRIPLENINAPAYILHTTLALVTPTKTAVHTWTPEFLKTQQVLLTPPSPKIYTPQQHIAVVPKENLDIQPREETEASRIDNADENTAETSSEISLTAQANKSQKNASVLFYVIGFLGIIIISIGGILTFMFTQKKHPSLDAEDDDIDSITIIE
jgi:hypothetical protein